MTRKKHEQVDAFEQILDEINPITATAEQNSVVENTIGGQNLHSSIVNVMKSVKNIDKSMTVGTGQNSYKGVADKDVKYIIGTAMANNHLTCLPVDIDEDVKVDRWNEETQYGVKSKQSIFTKVKVKFQLTHVLSNESIIIVGYGHGVDSQDKSAGKAMTYALKNALLYSFLVPTGAIDDTDATHSNNLPIPSEPQKHEFAWDNPKEILSDERFTNALKAISEGKSSKQFLTNKFALTQDQLKKVNAL
jgi:hypothetical protein